MHPDDYQPKHLQGKERIQGFAYGQPFRVTHQNNGTEDAENNDPNMGGRRPPTM